MNNTIISFPDSLVLEIKTAIVIMSKVWRPIVIIPKIKNIEPKELK